MANLKQLLEELEIDVNDDDDDDKNDEPDLSSVKLEDIPEEHRSLFKKAIDTIEAQTNEISKRDIMLNTLKDYVPKDKPKDKPKDEDEKILGVLDKDDPYAPAFQKLADAISGISKASEMDQEKKFQEDVTNFAKENPDIVRYAQDMDKLLAEHPSLQNDIPKLYLLAKNINERRDVKSKDRPKRNRQSGERSGVANSNVTDIKNYKSIDEAFEAAYNKIGGN